MPQQFAFKMCFSSSVSKYQNFKVEVPICHQHLLFLARPKQSGNALLKMRQLPLLFRFNF
jgi:hypothetical protein